MSTKAEGRPAMEAALEYGTHELLGQHLYRQASTTHCPTCNRQRVLYGGVCGSCGDVEARIRGDVA